MIDDIYSGPTKQELKQLEKQFAPVIDLIKDVLKSNDTSQEKVYEIMNIIEQDKGKHREFYGVELSPAVFKG